MKTVGDRIRYFRKDRKMTQDRLAELTGIHPVSIRKYETNKMQPQIEQIERIASVLDVNTAALVGYNSKPAVIQTVGDLMGVLISLFKSRVLMIIGVGHYNTEDPDNAETEALIGADPSKMLLMLNPVLYKLFDVAKITNFSKARFTRGKLTLKQLGLILNDEKCAAELMEWAAMYVVCEEYLAKGIKSKNPDIAPERVTEMLEDIELQMIANTMPLPTLEGIDGDGALLMRYGDEEESN